MSKIFDIADKYVDDLAALEPAIATSLGIPGHDHEMPDLSPEGPARVADLNRRSVAALNSQSPTDDHDRIARDVMLERLGVSLESFEAGEYYRALRNIASPLQGVRQVFDLMPKATEEDWSNIAARLKLVHDALSGYQETLRQGIQKGLVASKRQTVEGAEQARVWSGAATGEGKPSYFDTLQQDFQGVVEKEGFTRVLVADIAEGTSAATAAYASMHTFLRDEYLPSASQRESSGPDRYQLLSRAFLGATIDPQETYEWGWQELHRIEDEMRKTCDRIVPGGTTRDVTKLLESDPDRVVEGEDNYRAWLQELHNQALEDLHGKHFDIPDSIRKVEVMIPPPGGALAAYYTGPSEDLARPGRTWWPTGGNTRFPKWGDVTTVYHEGVPGHHLQVASTRLQADNLSRFQRVLTFISGHGEGWALYSERLMAELGYLENPDYYLGMLSGQALRAVRVVIDIGMHLELPIPVEESFHPGETWSHDLAVDFATARTGRPRQFMASEVVRYLGWPAQAISYKVGERHWLRIREAARQKQGASFDLQAFHTNALNLGPMGLAQLEAELI